MYRLSHGALVTLVCVGCGRTVECPDVTVNGERLLVWWIARRNGKCRELLYTAHLSDPDAHDVKLRHEPYDTDKRAAWAALPRSGTRRRQVLDLIVAAGSWGCIDHDLVGGLGMTINSVNPRRLELVEGGWIEDSGQRRPTPTTGCDSIVWVLTDEGRVRLAMQGAA